VDEDIVALAHDPQDANCMLAGRAKLTDDYTRAAMIHPLDPMIAFAGPAHQVGEHGRIIRSRDGGQNWELASDGLKLPMDDMVEFFVRPQ
jgi:hypothetical protein